MPIESIKRSVTKYFGNEGEEKALRTWNYNFDGNLIKTTTVFSYQNDTLDNSTTYRNTGSVTAPTETVKRSVTKYFGNEGEEKALRTWN